MLRSVAGRALWVVKGMALFWGAAMTLAVVLGLGSTALAAVPGDPFKLSQVNAAVATTALEGSIGGPLLQLSNSHDGSNTHRGPGGGTSDPPPIPLPGGGSPAPALGLSVHPGQPPLTVSPGASTAPNLDADKLDGRHASAFASGTNGRADDANLLDGKDSSAFASGTGGVATNSDRLDGRDQWSFATATNGVANNADRLDGLDSQELKESAKLRCPGGTTLFAGACIELQARGTGDFHTAINTCGGIGRRLPTSAELFGFKFQPGQSNNDGWPNYQWSGDVGDLAMYVVIVSDYAPAAPQSGMQNFSYAPQKHAYPFRCVASPTNG